MEKINFVDLPSTTTPISAANLNAIQNNVENAIEETLNIELIAVTDTAPSECSIGDKYYNTTNKKIYTATAMNTWSETGATPTNGILYIVYNEQASYSWDGTDLVSVGGGKEDIVIDDEEPTDPDVKLWIDTGEVQNLGSEIESGSNANGNYIKFADGTLIQYDVIDRTKFMTTSDIYTAVQGINIYRSNLPTINLPVNFINTNYNMNADIISSINGSRVYINRFAGKTRSTFQVQLLGLESFTENGVGYTNLVSVSWLAIGRWK